MSRSGWCRLLSRLSPCLVRLGQCRHLSYLDVSFKQVTQYNRVALAVCNGVGRLPESPFSPRNHLCRSRVRISGAESCGMPLQLLIKCLLVANPGVALVTGFIGTVSGAHSLTVEGGTSGLYVLKVFLRP